MALLDDVSDDVSGLLDGWPHQPMRSDCLMMASSADALGSPWLALGLPLITGPWLGTPRRYIEIYNERVKDLLIASDCI